MKIKVIATSLILLLTQGCSTGDLRAWNDALSAQNGYKVTYPDQSDTDWIGADDDIKWITGVRNGQGFQSLSNTGRYYCKVRIKYEDGSYDYFRLEPNGKTGSMYMSIYNQAHAASTLCNYTRDVFNDSFDD